MILEYQLAVFLIVSKLFASGEWIEMPQFSDESKIYKLSPRKHTSLYNEFANNYDRTTPEYRTKVGADSIDEFEYMDRQNGTDAIRSYSEGGGEEEEVSLHSPQLTTVSINSNDDPVNVSEEIIDTINSNSKEIASSTKESSKISGPSVTLELPAEELISDSTTVKPILSVTMPRDYSSEKLKYRNQTIVEDTSFENYLPMEMLKKVHSTLKSQPSTLNGKIQFLKQFEKDLITEIEKRLSIALAPTRRTRGTHDYYDYDEEIGFPSLEGALMSISFLTFAVYLVRLVMLLFRNPNNSSTGATILFNRNRRSTDTLIDDDNNSEEILHYLNTFDDYY